MKNVDVCVKTSSTITTHTADDPATIRTLLAELTSMKQLLAGQINRMDKVEARATRKSGRTRPRWMEDPTLEDWPPVERKVYVRTFHDICPVCTLQCNTLYTYI